jgi:DNA-binding response OmpR family regulator
MSHVSVTLAHTMADAISVLKERPVDLCLMETRLPDGDGFELCRKMRKTAPDVPIIFYSGDAADGFRRMGMAAGADEYLVKPNFDSLTHTVTAYLSTNDNANGRAASENY